MDPELALLILESELLGETRIEVDQMDQLGEAVAAAAMVSAGYSGLAWEGGAKLLEVARRSGQDPAGVFATFGWRALANGIQAALHDRQLLSALSYVNIPFVPPDDSSLAFDHPQIAAAIRTSLVTTPRPFIKPSDLGAADPAVQAEFGELLNRLPNFSADSELILQWSASALRVLPAQSKPYQLAAISLLQTLCQEGRIAAAYYALRALAEQREDLWEQPTALEVLRLFVDRYWQDQEMGNEALAQLCTDDEILRRLDKQFDILVLVGSLAINQVRHFKDKRMEATAWRFVDEMFVKNALLANAFGYYLNDGGLPPLPIPETDQLKTLEQDFNKAIASVEKELRPRKYKPLAGRIYQSTMQDVFIPLRNEIQFGHCSIGLVQRIRGIDPEGLVTDSPWLQSSPDRIGTKVLRKMTTDNMHTLRLLEAAALKRIELDKARAEWADRPNDEFQLFQEFDSLAGELGATAIWALKTLLPDIWTRFREGTAIVEKELEARRYAAR
jgi:hypothetical protein